MHRRRLSNVPIEILRSIISISETGSISKAAKLLGVSQPAISAQMKRIEDLVGGAVFTKSANGSVTTDLGELVLMQARKILEANRQILLLRGARNEHRGLRMGLSDLHARTALRALRASKFDDVSIIVNCPTAIAKGLMAGHVDLGLMLTVPNFNVDPAIEVLSDSNVDLVWARSPDFVISPGAPIPVITWGGHTVHQMMVDSLERRGLIYRIVFSSPDHQARIEAAEQGLGLMVLPHNLIPTGLMEAREYYLPALSAAKLRLCRRTGVDIDHERLIVMLQEQLFGSTSQATHQRVG